MGGCCIGNCCVMNNAVGDFFRDIFSPSNGGCAYHPQSLVTEAHAKKIADELAAMKEGVRKSSEKKVQESLNSINEVMTELMRQLEDVNKKQFGGKSLNINIKGIREKNEELQKEAVGYIGDVIEDRFVLTDKELSVILEERDDKKRAKNFDAFKRRVQAQALSGLGKKIETTVRKQEQMIRNAIELRLKEVDKSMKAAMKAYSEIVSAKEKDESKMEETRIKYIYKYELTAILLDQLGDV